jgi:DNA (cytosine-5)-methyltransferase 1
MTPEGDIRQIEATSIPKHDLLCAGFPCQPFSKAGIQGGLEDPKWGGLFFHILRILKHHKPHLIMLENVPNIVNHDSGKTWRKVEDLLKGVGYDVRARKLSPHRYGIPQIRERIFVVGSLSGLNDFAWPEETNQTTSIKTILEQNPQDARQLSAQVLACINVWQDFLNRFPKDEHLPSFPIWGMEFGATYPYERKTPFALGKVGLRGYLGAHGEVLDGSDDETVLSLLPAYARTKEQQFPHWKVQFIKQNRKLYERHYDWLDRWRPQLLQFPASFQKFEWNAKGEVRNLNELVLQVRASGVRAKRPTTAPSLVAMTTTQVPIITWEKRYMTPRECARLQSMDELTLPETPTLAYAALGNAVNVRVVELIAESLFAHEPNFDNLTGSVTAAPGTR